MIRYDEVYIKKEKTCIYFTEKTSKEHTNGLLCID